MPAFIATTKKENQNFDFKNKGHKPPSKTSLSINHYFQIKVSMIG